MCVSVRLVSLAGDRDIGSSLLARQDGVDWDWSGIGDGGPETGDWDWDWTTGVDVGRRTLCVNNANDKD